MHPSNQHKHKSVISNRFWGQSAHLTKCLSVLLTDEEPTVNTKLLTALELICFPGQKQAPWAGTRKENSCKQTKNLFTFTVSHQKQPLTNVLRAFSSSWSSIYAMLTFICAELAFFSPPCSIIIINIIIIGLSCRDEAVIRLHFLFISFRVSHCFLDVSFARCWHLGIWVTHTIPSQLFQNWGSQDNFKGSPDHCK